MPDKLCGHCPRRFTRPVHYLHTIKAAMRYSLVSTSGFIMKSVLHIPGQALPTEPEFFETLFSGQGRVRVERIISHGHTTPADTWYDQEEDEWVLILEGEAVILYHDQLVRLARGDSLLLPRHVRHRVEFTSSPCIWLAVFGDNLQAVTEGNSL